LAADERTVARGDRLIERFCEQNRLSRAGEPTPSACRWRKSLSNIVVHGYERQPGKLSIELHYDRRAFSVIIEDRGKPFDPTQAAAPHLLVVR